MLELKVIIVLVAILNFLIIGFPLAILHTCSLVCVCICVCMILEDFNTEIRWYPEETRGEKYFLAEKPGANKRKKVIAENRILNNWGHAADSE